MTEKAKFCKKCGKGLSKWNKTGLCRTCYIIKKNREREKRLKEQKRCICCGKKIEPTYQLKCKRCRGKQREYIKRWKQKNQKT